MHAMWKVVVLLPLMFAGCSDSSANPLAPSQSTPRVAPNRLRMTNLRHQRNAEDWALDWLKQEGWSFWGYELEAGSDDHLDFTWREVRADKRFAHLSLHLEAREPVRVYVAVKLLKSHHDRFDLHCSGCDTSHTLLGSANYDSMACPKCELKLPISTEWTKARFREFRVLVRGRVKDLAYDGLWGDVKYPPNSMRSLPSPQGGGHELRVFNGAIPREYAYAWWSHPIDVNHIMRGERPTHEYGKGQHTLASLFPLGNNMGAGKISGYSGFHEDGSVAFDSRKGGTGVGGTERGFDVFVNNEATPVTDYPHPVWEFALHYR